MCMALANVKEFVKQMGVWLAITTLLPLVAYYGTGTFRQPPDSDEYFKASESLDEKIRQASDESEKKKLKQEKQALDKDNREAERNFYRDMFWVAYPLGLLAVIIGTFFPVQAVGAGFIFGGLISLAIGCYSYWEKMGDWMRFNSLLIALLVVIVLGTWRFRRSNVPSNP